MGMTSVKIFRRLIDMGIGFVGFTGQILATPVDHEVGLEISNGANDLGPLLENNKFKENFLVKIGDDFYQIAEIDGTELTLVGPDLEWGTGTPVAYEIVQVIKESPVFVDGTEFFNLDRRNREIIEIETETVMPMALVAKALHAAAKGEEFIEAQLQQEHVEFQIEWKNNE